MNEFNKAKKCYDSIEIPQELGQIVQASVDLTLKKNPVKVYLMRFVPVAVCAFICFSIGINYISDFEESEAITEAISADTAAESSDSGKQFLYNRTESKVEDGAVREKLSMAKGIGEYSAVADKSKAMPFAVYNSFVQTKIDKSINECVELESTEEAYGELEEIYSDEEVVSYSITTYPSNITNFYNVKQSDGSDISIESIIGDDVGYNSSNCKFYIKARDKLVVIQNGKEIEVIID